MPYGIISKPFLKSKAINLNQEIIDQHLLRLAESEERILKCLELLSHEQIWERPNERTNSVGNLVLHLIGNLSQYVLSSLGGEIDNRSRDREFELSSKVSKADLISQFSSCLQACKGVIHQLSSSELERVRRVQAFKLSGLGILVHIVEHTSYHTGQIALLTKVKLNRDLEFYAGMDLNQKN